MGRWYFKQNEEHWLWSTRQNKSQFDFKTKEYYITLHQTNEAFFEYYSNNNFRDADGVWLPQATADTDEILFTDEAYDAWVYSVCELVVQNASYDAVDSRESTRITDRKLTAIAEHRRKFPSMQKPQSYNIASDVSL